MERERERERLRMVQRRVCVTLSHFVPVSRPPWIAREACSAQHAENNGYPHEDEAITLPLTRWPSPLGFIPGPEKDGHPREDEALILPLTGGHLPLVSYRHQYERMYSHSLQDPDSFWGSLAKQFHWEKSWDPRNPICRFNFDRSRGPIFVEWFRGGYTNICYNALDRHVLSGNGNRTAILWEGNQPGQESFLTYKDMLDYTCQLANFLHSKNVVKGDKVCIYMPMIPELAVAMLACARIGVIHSVIFAGFSADSLAGRMLDCRPKILITSSAFKRGNKFIDMKSIVDEAFDICLQKENFNPDCCIVYHNSELSSRESTPWKHGRDLWWQDVLAPMKRDAPLEWMEAEEPLFMLYTSGSTGKPKGVVHTVGGYMVYAGVSFKYIFDHRPEDVFWCTADCGWITGHTYVVYGPFLNCATCVIFEGVPTWPDPGRCWEIIEKFKVTTFYTSPTLIRTLQASGDQYLKKHDRSTLRLLGTVGEPIDSKAWHWCVDAVGEKRCPIVDTWWQTETGGAMITPLPWAWPLKPGSATLPFFGVQPVILDEKGREQSGPCEGYLCVKTPWPGMARTLYENHSRFEESYFSIWSGYYATGDGCRRDADGYYWILGRVDDVINVSGHRISTGEVESALNSHPTCAEASVVPIDHGVKGQGIYAFVVLVDGARPSEKLRRSYIDIVKKEIGSFASPETIHWVPGLPKTRSGKIMRRILRKLAANQVDNLGDVSSLVDPSIVEEIMKTRPS